MCLVQREPTTSKVAPGRCPPIFLRVSRSPRLLEIFLRYLGCLVERCRLDITEDGYMHLQHLHKIETMHPRCAILEAAF